jgi:hypothetical protein
MYKNWPQDARVGGFLSMQKFMEMEETIMDDNEEVIASLDLLEVDEGQNKVCGLGMFFNCLLHFDVFFFQVLCHNLCFLMYSKLFLVVVGLLE